MFKHCPECKHSTISFVNNHYLSCGECGFLYYHNAAAAVAAIIQYKDEILLTVRAKEPGLGQLDLPGGFVDHNESLEQALAREISEELSLDIPPKVFKYFTSEPNTYHYQNIKYNTIDSIFTLLLDHKPSIVCEPSEIVKVVWVKQCDIDYNQLAFTSAQKALLKYTRH